MGGHFSSDSKLAAWLLRSLRHPSQPIRDLQDLAGLYEAKVWFTLNDLDGVADEIHHVIDLLPSVQGYTDAVVAVKFYVVSWCTLCDVLAKLVNAIFDLGIDEKDINLMMVLRNKHVKASGLPEILSKHQARIRHSDFRGMRNDILHRGVLRDPKLQAINDRLARLELLRVFDKAQAEEESDAIERDLENYLLNKPAELTKHLNDTITMLDEMVNHMFTVLTAKIESARSN